jgi:HlyD family secretion protein
MFKITKKRTLYGGIALAVIIIFLVSKSCGSKAEYEYSYEKVSTGLVEKTISSTGTLEVEGKLPILSRITAPINSVKVAVEQRVSRGQILAVLDTMDIDQRLLRLSTKLESSQLAVTSEQRKYEGKKNMFKENLVSSKDLEQTELEYKTALNNYRLAQLEYNETVSQKRDAVMRSPIDGVIIESAISGLSVIRQNDAAFFVAPSLSRMQLILNIDESDMARQEGTEGLFHGKRIPG